MRKYQKYKNINYDNCKLIDYGSEGQIYLYEGKALKDFTFGDGWNKSRIDTLKNKRKKLELLQKLHHPNHPQIYTFYLLENRIMRVYSMDYLKDNGIEDIALSDCFDEKLWLVNKMWQNVKEENKEDVYNFDINWCNFSLDKDGNLYTIDIDNLKVGKYSSDMEPISLECFLASFPGEVELNNTQIQNFSMLVNILTLFVEYDSKNLSLYELRSLIIENIKSQRLQTIMLNIIDGKDEDIEEVLALTKNLKLNN